MYNIWDDHKDMEALLTSPCGDDATKEEKALTGDEGKNKPLQKALKKAIETGISMHSINELILNPCDVSVKNAPGIFDFANLNKLQQNVVEAVISETFAIRDELREVCYEYCNDGYGDYLLPVSSYTKAIKVCKEVLDSVAPFAEETKKNTVPQTRVTKEAIAGRLAVQRMARV